MELDKSSDLPTSDYGSRGTSHHMHPELPNINKYVHHVHSFTLSKSRNTSRFEGFDGL